MEELKRRDEGLRLLVRGRDIGLVIPEDLKPYLKEGFVIPPEELHRGNSLFQFTVDERVISTVLKFRRGGRRALAGEISRRLRGIKEICPVNERVKEEN